MGRTHPATEEPDFRHIRVEIEDLRTRLEAADQDRMAYFLTCARIVADLQIRASEAVAADMPGKASRRKEES